MTLEQLMEHMAAVLWDGHNKRWDARAKGCAQFAKGATPREAMEEALRIFDDEL